MTQEIKLKSFMNRLGNKKKYIKYFVDYIPKKYNNYIEPFVGSGSLFLYLKPKSWIINDLNKNLMDLWILVKNNPKYLINKLKLFWNNYSKHKNHEERLLFLKKETEKLNNMKISINKSIFWFILNRLSFMGGMTINKNKYYFSSINNMHNTNIPYIMKTEYFNLINNINYYLNSTTGKIYNTDYKNILKKAKENDFIFLDPPYIKSKKVLNYYHNDHDYSIKFLKELYNEVKKLDKKGVKWMMTQEDSKEIKNIFKEYKIRKYKIYRISSKKYEHELFITNY